MKPGLLFIILTLASVSFAQSGRVKPAETPTPRPNAQPTIVYIPTQTNSKPPAPKVTPTPANDDDVVRVNSALVPIPVSILDARGQPVTSLRISDFELKIDGRPAEIGDLARSETPIRLAMLFDILSVLIAREFEKVAAIKFLKRVIRPEKDLAALYSVSTISRREQPFTAEISSLTRAIELFPPPVGATALLEGIIDASEYLREVHGRRVMIIVSDGDDTKSDVTFEETVRALQVANCQVYVVKTTDFENFKRTGSRRGNANIRQLAAESRMREIAEQTGGAVYSPIDERELDDAFKQIIADLSQQYILSYYPDDDDSARRGQFRRISLSLKGKPGMSVRTRTGYYVPKR